MRNFTFILILIFSSSCSALHAQSYTRFDTAFTTSAYNKFFQRNPSVRQVQIRAEEMESVSVQVFSKTDNGKMYDLRFEGDKYFFNKEYGDLEPPTRFLETLSAKSCKAYWYTYFNIVPDTVYVDLQYLCYETTTEHVFTKVENNVRFEGDKSIPETMIRQALQGIEFKDSIFLLQAIVDRDGNMHPSQVLHGNDTTATNIIFHTLEEMRGWKPALQGSRTIKAYTKIFVRVFPDKKIRAYFEHMH